MFEATRVAPDRLDVRVAGKFDAEDMQAALTTLTRESGGMQQAMMVYRIGDIQWPTLGALGVELARMPELFRLMGRFSRIAVITDAQWIQRVSELEGALIPGLNIKAFDKDAEDAAIRWLEQDH
ncbi:MAG: STAS/SEC14 domain-containing protein [Pseudomonadota bacterium]